MARSVIDQNIARLEENIRALKSSRNQLSPISRLPPEVLCNIFSFIEDRSKSQARSPESWTNFSRVSQYWRSLALSAPELWTNIPFIYPRWAEEMLTRSKMAKLTLRVDLEYQSALSRVLDPIKTCLSQITRLEEINISDASGSVLEKIFQDLPKSAPQLHTFHITSPQPRHLSGPDFTIDEDFFTDTERLRCVHLVRCKINWDSRLLTSLTRLTLHHTLKDSSFIQFLHALQRMPALTELDLESSIPYDSKPSSYPLVDLPCLRVLRIMSGFDIVTTTLRHMTFPSTTALNLICHETQFNRINFSSFLSVLDAKFLSSFVIRSLSLQDLDITMQTGLRFLVRSTTNVLFSPGGLDLVLTWANSNLQTYSKALIVAFNAMNLRTLIQLHLSTSYYIDSKTWLKTFGRLPLLERVYVKNDAAYSFLETLCHKTKAADRSIAAYRSVSFPKLRYICMNGTRFESISVDELMDILMERYERKAEIQALRLEDCHNIFKDDIEKLCEIVVDVDWDGLEQGLYDSEEGRTYDSEGNIIDDFGDYDYYDELYHLWL